MPIGRSQSKRFLLVAGAAAAVLGALWILVSRGLTLEEIQRIGREAGELSEGRPVLVFGILLAAQAVGMGLGLPTKALLTLLAGALLGTVMGSIATLLGVLAGASGLFLAVRYFFRDRITKHFGERANKIEKRISKRPIRTMIGLRLFIALPYGPCTISAALSSMRFSDFLIGSAVGDIPVIVLYSAAGRELFSLASASEALSPFTVAVLVAAGAVFIVSAVWGSKR